MDREALTNIALPQDLTLMQDEQGFMTLQLEEPLGFGSMRALAVMPEFLPALVDFHCERCPNTAELAYAPGDGRWMSVNLCLEGRCEVSIPHQGYAVVKAGDCCVSCSNEPPEDYRYPLHHYRGIEVFLHTSLDTSVSPFALFEEAGGSMEGLARDAGFAAVFSGEPQLNEPLEHIGQALEAYRAGDIDQAEVSIRCRYELLGFLLALLRCDIVHAQPRALLTPNQLAIARDIHDEVEGSLFIEHDVRDFAKRYGIAATTLNRYFTDLYGCTVASYLRRRRMEEARTLLRKGASVAEVAVEVGYSNPSKFAAAFKREGGETPTEFKRSACR